MSDYTRSRRSVSQFVGGAQRGEVKADPVDVVHAEFDRLAQHCDRLVTIAWLALDANAAPRWAKRIVPDPIQ